VQKSGNDDKHLNRPAGIAVDGAGNVLIADYGNNRIVVFSPAGKFLGKVAVDTPYGLAVDRKRGTLYVLSVAANAHGGPGWQKMYVAKVSGWKEPKELGKVDVSIGSYDTRYGLVMALDDGAEAPILWLGDGSGPSAATLGRIVDRAPADEGLPKLEKVSLPASATGMRGCLRVIVDPASDRVYVNHPLGNCSAQGWQSFDGHSGKALPTGKLNGGMSYMTSDLRVGHDGTLYGYVYDGGLSKPGVNNQQLRRWDLDGNPLKLEGGAEASEPFPLGPKTAESMKAKKQGRGDHQQARGLDVAADGNVYVIHNWEMVHDYRLSVLGPDGKARKVNLCPNLTLKGCCPRVDRQGNIYVLEGLLPKDVPLGPPGFAGLEKAGAGKPSGYCGFFGCIIKFPPGGGAVGEAKEMPAPAEGVKRVVTASGALVDNAIWIHPYASPAMGSHCICNNGHFDIDRYGRLFVPNALARQVEVLDTEGNRICVFGRYGNVDNGGKESRRPVDGVPLNWGVDVAVSDTAAYISDLSNRCVVKVRLDYQAAASCLVP
jgi:hypothetical protein